MKKVKCIARFGKEGYNRRLARERMRKKEHPEAVVRARRERERTGGKYYAKKLEYSCTGLPGARHNIRIKHAKMWRPYKNIIAPGSQIHHEWIPRSANYRGVALVEADQHMHGVIKVIEVLEGNITMLTEVEVNGGVE